LTCTDVAAHMSVKASVILMKKKTV
jgi:hypothetical protein